MANTFPNGWRMRATIGIKSARVGGATLTNFPTFFKWDGTQANSNLPSAMFSGNITAQSAGADVRFTTDSVGLSLMPVEVVSFSTTSPGKAEIWAKIPSISSASDTSIYAWWGNPLTSALAVSDTNGRNNVWSDYSAVYHLETVFTNATGATQWDMTNVGTSDVTGAYYPGRGRHLDTSNYMWDRSLLHEYFERHLASMGTALQPDSAAICQDTFERFNDERVSLYAVGFVIRWVVRLNTDIQGRNCDWDDTVRCGLRCSADTSNSLLPIRR